MPPIFFDTNILVYATLNQDVEKQCRAAKLISDAIVSQTFCISAQVLKELANILIRKSNKDTESIYAVILHFTPYVMVVDTPDLVLHALELRGEHDLQFFDALLIAGAEAAGCQIVYSEDMADGMRYGNVKIVNPFC